MADVQNDLAENETVVVKAKKGWLSLIPAGVLSVIFICAAIVFFVMATPNRIAYQCCIYVNQYATALKEGDEDKCEKLDKKLDKMDEKTEKLSDKQQEKVATIVSNLYKDGRNPGLMSLYYGLISIHMPSLVLLLFGLLIFLSRLSMVAKLNLYVTDKYVHCKMSRQQIKIPIGEIIDVEDRAKGFGSLLKYYNLVIKCSINEAQPYVFKFIPNVSEIEDAIRSGRDELNSQGDIREDNIDEHIEQ